MTRRVFAAFLVLFAVLSNTVLIDTQPYATLPYVERVLGPFQTARLDYAVSAAPDVGEAAAFAIVRSTFGLATTARLRSIRLAAYGDTFFVGTARLVWVMDIDGLNEETSMSFRTKPLKTHRIIVLASAATGDPILRAGLSEPE